MVNQKLKNQAGKYAIPQFVEMMIHGVMRLFRQMRTCSNEGQCISSPNTMVDYPGCICTGVPHGRDGNEKEIDAVLSAPSDN